MDSRKVELYANLGLILGIAKPESIEDYSGWKLYEMRVFKGCAKVCKR